MAVKFDLNNFLVDRVRRGTMFSDTTGEALWSITQINDATLSMTSETADVTDAIGNIITQFDRSKNAEFSGSNALWDLGLSAAQFGSKKIVAGTTGGPATITVPTYEQITASEHTLTLKNTPKNTTPEAETAIKYIYKLNSDSTLGTRYEYNAGGAEAGKFTISGKVITLEASETGTFAVFYEYDSDAAVSIANNASEFPKAGRFVLEVIGKDTCDKTATYVAYIVFPNAKLRTDFDLSFTTDGGHPFSMQMMQDYCDLEKRLFNVYIAK